MTPDRQARLTPETWGDTLSGAPILTRRLNASDPVLVRRWRAIAPDIVQPPLDHHYVTLHLGGPKRIRRRGEGGEALTDIAHGSYSVTPAGSAFQWRTEGAVDFAHLYLQPSHIDDVISAEFDRDARQVSFQDALGARDPLVEALLAVLVDESEGDETAGRLYWDGLMHTLICRMLNRHSSLPSITAAAPHGLAPCRVRRVVEFIEAHLADDITASDLAAVAGVSAFHFSRGFRRATGSAPYAFLIQKRLQRAMALLDQTELPLADIARNCGFGSHSQFSTMFRRASGLSPSHYRVRR